MLKKTKWMTVLIIGVFLVFMAVLNANAATQKPGPDEAIDLLKAGNARFVTGQCQHSNTDSGRLAQAGRENQGDHAYATVITCSDSRVPVERVFDAGVMDIFVIRVAGNVCDTDEIGSIEYGLAHVNTPVMVVLGHTQCGAVTAVTHAIHGTGHALERNIPPLVDNIQPAVKRAMRKNPQVQGDDIIPYAIEENVWQGIEDLFLNSPSTRELVRSGKTKVVGAIYDVGSGDIRWLPEFQSEKILAKVEANPQRAMNAMAGGEHGDSSPDSQAAAGHSAPAASSHGVPADSHGTGHAAVSVHAKEITLVPAAKLQQLDSARHRKVETSHASFATDTSGMSVIWQIVIGLAIVVVIIGVAWQSGFFARMGIAGKLYTGFGAIVILAIVIGLGGYYFLAGTSQKAQLEVAAMEFDMMADKINKLQYEFLLYGIEDKQHGDKAVAEVKGLLEDFITDLAAMRASDIDSEDAATLDRMEQGADAYHDVFVELVEKFHEVEEYKEELDKLGSEVDQELAEVLHRHESELAELEAEGASIDVIATQVEFVEKLAACELLAVKISHEEVEFLLDKHIDRVVEMEHEFGQLYGTLEAVKGIIPEAALNESEEAEDLAMIKKVEEQLHEYQKKVSRVIEDILIVEADVIDATEDLGIIQTNASALSEKAGHLSEQMKSEANIVSIFLIILAAVFGSIMALTIVRGVTKPINRIIVGLREGAEQVTSASSQVSSASQSLAEGATEQAAGLEETSSSLEEMASMTKQNAENAAQANNLSSEARKAADSGNESMGRMSSAINDIQKSSEETAKIIKVIDEIAFQTNLLALNAAVEAARAGEAGKGFAVVAEEVRNLAMRSAEAAKNTAGMIEESVKNSQNGVDIAGEVAKSLEEIVTGVGKATDLVAEIAAASQEQAQGIDQVNTAMTQMDKVTQQNAANAEESASASEELSAQAEQMNSVVGELVTLVGGSSGGNGQAATSRKYERNHLNKDYSSGDETFHHIASGTSQAKKAPKTPTRKPPVKTAAEQAIPLNDDDAGDGFDEFNVG